MKKFIKWSYRVLSALRVRVDRGLAQAEQVTDDARLAMQRTQEALAHTERAIQGVRRTVSSKLSVVRAGRIRARNRASTSAGVNAAPVSTHQFSTSTNVDATCRATRSPGICSVD